MKNKTLDEFYCGVDEEKIKNAHPILNKEVKGFLYTWLSERYKIHLKKDVQKLPKPWTEFIPLRDYKFTNVRREHDRETKWLIKHIVKNDEVSYDNKLLNVALFRLYNKHVTSELFGDWIDFFNLSEEYLEELEQIFEKQVKNESLFTNAFFVSGIIRSLKIFFKHYALTNPIRLIWKERDNFLEAVKNAKNQKEVFEAIVSNLFGVGEFLGYQIFVDMTYIDEFPFSENEFVVAGPGCIAGINLLFDDKDGLNYDECIFWLRDNQKEIFKEFGYDPKKLFSDLPEWDRKINLMSQENQLCELSKFTKLMRGTGRPRIKYPGKEKTQTKIKLLT